jgi:hypothetical protein
MNAFVAPLLNMESRLATLLWAIAGVQLEKGHGLY